MNVLIADDHKIVRMGLSLVVGEEYPAAVIDHAGNAAEVLRHIRSKKYQMILMDLHMPDTDSTTLLEQILSIDPQVRVLIVTLNPERIFALRYLKAGAHGYVQKSEDDTLIRNAIRRVMDGKKYMSEDVLDQMTEYLRSGKPINPFELLSKREFEICMHLIKGVAINEICAIMSLQGPTVSTYKGRILEKLNIRSVHELVILSKEYDIS